VGNTCLYIKPDTTLAESRDRRDNEVETLISMAVKDADLTLLNDRGVIADRISDELIRQVAEADIVVIDAHSYEKSDAFLSPSLYYLMAFSHTLGNKTILVSDSLSHLQRCMINHHTLTYTDAGIAGFRIFSQEFCETVKRIQAGDDKPDNPIQDYLKSVSSRDAENKLERLEAEVSRYKAESSNVAEKVTRMEAELASQKVRYEKLKSKETEIEATYGRAVDKAGRINFRPSPLRD